MDLTAFRARFPVFGSAPDALVNVCLAEALVRTPRDVFTVNGDAAQGYLAAHLLMIDANGQASRLEIKDIASTYGQSAYGLQYQELMYAATAGLRLI